MNNLGIVVAAVAIGLLLWAAHSILAYRKAIVQGPRCASCKLYCEAKATINDYRTNTQATSTTARREMVVAD